MLLSLPCWLAQWTSTMAGWLSQPMVPARGPCALPPAQAADPSDSQKPLPWLPISRPLSPALAWIPRTFSFTRNCSIYRKASTDSRNEPYSSTLIPRVNDLYFSPFWDETHQFSKWAWDSGCGQDRSLGLWRLLDALARPQCIVEVGQEIHIVNCGWSRF